MENTMSMKNFIKISIFFAIIYSSISSTAAPRDIKENLLIAEQSTLFKDKFASSRITEKGLDKVMLDNGVDLNFKKYTTLTRLDNAKEYQPLMNQKVVSKYLLSQPSYQENIIQLEDRLIVEREIQVKMKSNTCKIKSLPRAISDLCFKTKKGSLSKETKIFLKTTRHKLAISPPQKIVKQGQSVTQVMSMSDDQLLEFLLNSDDRTIRLVSVLPTKVYHERPSDDIWNMQKKLPTSNLSHKQSLVSEQFQNAPPESTQQNSNSLRPKNKTHAKKYFLTGFTLGREVRDDFEIEFARSTWLTDRYFLRFSYEFSAGFGLRFPFSVSVESKAVSSLTPDAIGGDLVAIRDRRTSPTKNRNRFRRAEKVATTTNTTVTSGGDSGSSGDMVNIVKKANVKVSVDVVNVDNKGLPAYPKVGLPLNKYFEGKEFVLELKAACNFIASIPGPNIEANCQGISKDFSRQINPIIGSDTTELAALWLDGSLIGLGIEIGAGSASIDFGIQANMTNGRIKVNAKGLNNSLIGGQADRDFNFNSTAASEFQVVNNSNQNAVFLLDSPAYGFDIEVSPAARVKLELDLGIKTLKQTVGPYSIDALAITLASTGVGHHEGTTSSYIYEL